MEQLLINQIQPFSVHDGPGIRTTVFLQGCNLRCAWCHNPETWASEPTVSYTPESCIGCGQCTAVCPTGAQRIENGRHIFDMRLCQKCFACTRVCCAQALTQNGRAETPESLLPVLLRDKRLYQLSGGGVSFSGGEPLLQIRALEPLCAQLRAQGVHIAFESALCLPWSTVELCLSCADLLLVDCKMLDAARHRAYTGADNRLILENIRRISSQIDFAIRMPVIGGVNNTEEELAELAAFLKPLSARLREIELLPYHNYGIVKAARVGLEQQSFQPPSEQRMEALRGILSAAGLPVK